MKSSGKSKNIGLHYPFGSNVGPHPQSAKLSLIPCRNFCPHFEFNFCGSPMVQLLCIIYQHRKPFLLSALLADASLLVQFATRRPASADRTPRRQFQSTGQPVSRTQASDAMTSRLLRYAANCVQRRCFQCGSVPLRSDIKGTELPLPIY